ncbi:MAG: hypothetical protein CMQ15_18425 [Gammaproteobacteria bacterium]|nr:hypothetical protein [Gammaproteobacteria bacterium]
MRNDSYCEVLIGLNEPEYEFYKYEYFSQGFDQYDEERIVGFRDHFCDDRNGENYTYGRCSR